MRLATIAMIVTLAVPAHAETRRVAVIVGNNAGNEVDDSLRYAEDDAAKVARVLTELGGVATQDLFLVQGGNLARLDRSLREAKEKIAAYRASGRDRVVVIFYYSGHSDGVALELGRDRYAYSSLRQWLAQTSADVRLGFVDACKSGALLAAKGGTPGPAFQIRLTDDLASTGEALLTSSAATEDALESQEIGGSFFTHHLVSGLRGAADSSGDRQVTLGEAYRYAYAHTITTSGATLAGPQHPVYDYRISGQGEVVLTELARPTAALAFPATLERALVIDDARKQVIAELVGSGASLAVMPGSYTVRAWRGGKVVEGRVKVAAKQVRTVAWSDLPTPVTLSRPRPKGDLEARFTREQPPIAVTVGFGIRTALTNDVGAMNGARIGVAETSPSGLHGGIEVATGSDGPIGETFALASGGYQWGFARGPLILRSGVEMGAGFVSQEASNGGWSGTFLVGVSAGIDVAVTRRIALAIEAHVDAALAKVDRRTTPLPTLAAWFGVRVGL